MTLSGADASLPWREKGGVLLLLLLRWILEVLAATNFSGRDSVKVVDVLVVVVAIKVVVVPVIAVIFLD